MALRALLPLLLVAFPLAGCMGPGDEAETAQAPDETPASTTLEANVTTTGEGPLGNVTAQDLPLLWEGRIGRGGCLPSGPERCTRVDVSEDDSFFVFEDGRPARFTATLTWSAAAPTTQELAFGLLALRSCGEGCREGRLIGDQFATGASPLTLQDVALGLAEDEQLGMFVSEEEPCHVAAVVFACASPVEQPFKVEGTLVAVVPV